MNALKIYFFIAFAPIIVSGQLKFSESILTKLENPISVQYLKRNLRKTSPRLILTPTIERRFKQKIKTDPVVSNVYKAMQLNAQHILTEPLLERKVVGRRLLATSREMLYRMNILGMVYRIEKDPKVLNRFDEELKAVCNFQDWNPSHYLDVAEDAGSFIFELDGVRWVVDPGNQDYNELEQAGFDFWGRCQTCERWTLLTKNNFGHSTLTVNDKQHEVDGFASLTDFKDGAQPEATFDMTEVFKDQLQSAKTEICKRK